jgi:hypothetical protein
VHWRDWSCLWHSGTWFSGAAVRWAVCAAVGVLFDFAFDGLRTPRNKQWYHCFSFKYFFSLCGEKFTLVRSVIVMYGVISLMKTWNGKEGTSREKEKNT